MTGFVYAISDGQGRVKIGWSSDPIRRLNKIASDCSTPPTLVGVVPATKAQEQEAHELLAKWRLHREWFALAGPVIDFVDLLPKPRPRSLRKDIHPDDHPLRVWRKRNGHTVYSLGKLINVPYPTVSRWEKHGRLPRPAVLKRLKEITGLTTDDFYSRKAAQ